MRRFRLGEDGRAPVGVLMVIDKLRHTAAMTFAVETPDLATLSRVLALIDQVPTVAEVRRRVP